MLRPKFRERRAGVFFLGLLAVAGILGRGGHALPSDDRTFPAEDLRLDLRVLWAVLEEGHGGFDRYVPRNVQKTNFDAVAAGLTGPLSEVEFFRRLLPLVAGVKDGHTALLLSPATRSGLLAQPVLFPFELRWIGERVYLFRNLSQAREVRDGTEIMAVNGIPMDEIRRILLPLIPADANTLSRRLRLLENPNTFGLNYAVAFGRPESFRLRLRDASGRESGVTVPGITGADLGALRRERYPDTAVRKPLYELSYRGATAVLTIRGFGDERGSGSVGYPEFIHHAFRELQEKKIETLIIDVRGNGGGRDEYGRLLFAHFMDRPFLYYRALEMKKNRYDLFKYAPPGRENWPGDAVRKNDRGWFDVTDHPNVGTMNPETPRFTGRTCILIDGLSFSTTGESTSHFHFHKKAVFVGEECGAGYYGNTSGSTASVMLPKTGLQLRVPLVLYTLAVDGYPKDRGIVPDIPVTPAIEDLLAGRDVAMERALAFLKGKAGAGK
ncbi:MAG: hypothetical protein JW843_09625 [Candidatus Aminicenantes bacterium]|nr:hypothetical protein [Candidatus Aminicenantes bacterium]